MLFYYIRHGNPIYEPDGLTELGHKQAEALALKFKNIEFSKIYSSTSNRAILTAKPTADVLNKQIIEVDFAHEKHPWNNLTINTDNGSKCWLYQTPSIIELFNTEEITKLGFKWYEHKAFENYNFKNEMDRIKKEKDEFFLSLGYRHIGDGKYKVERSNGDNIAMFAHQGFGLAFIATILDIPYPKFSTHFDMGHSSVTVIEFKEIGGYAYPRIVTFSDESHLYKEGVRITY